MIYSFKCGSKRCAFSRAFLLIYIYTNFDLINAMLVGFFLLFKDTLFTYVVVFNCIIYVMG